MLKTINIRTKAKNEFVDITQDIHDTVSESNAKTGMCYVYAPHTTAGITINEGADPSVIKDIQATLNRLVPVDSTYSHAEGNSDAHIKSLLTGLSEVIVIENGRLILGTWQSIFFCEFDGPRNRRVIVKIIGDKG